MLFKDKFLIFIKSKVFFLSFSFDSLCFLYLYKKSSELLYVFFDKENNFIFFFAKPREKLSRLQNFLEIHFYVNILKMPLTNKINLSELF